MDLTPLYCPNKVLGSTSDKVCGQGSPVFDGFDCKGCGFSQPLQYRNEHIRTQDALLAAIQRRAEEHKKVRPERLL